jgi:hypothetical protein
MANVKVQLELQASFCGSVALYELYFFLYVPRLFNAHQGTITLLTMISGLL